MEWNGNGRTATLRTHDSDNGIGKATGGEVGGLDEVVEAGDVEDSVAVDELRGAAIIIASHDDSEFGV